MNTQTAVRIAEKVAELIQMCASFRARFDASGIIRAGSSSQAWELYHAINLKQAEIGELLDTQALYEPYRTRTCAWWQRSDIPDMACGNTMMNETANLIAASAYYEAQNRATGHSHAAFSIQSMIAGLLHPAAIQQALSLQDERSQRVAG